MPLKNNYLERMCRVEVKLKSIVDDQPPLFNILYESDEKRRRSHCGHLHRDKAA